MARRGGRLGSYLMSDDLTGFVRYASKLKKDYWGSWTEKPLKRNLQEIASPLNDPLPVNPSRPANYEITPVCVGELAPFSVGSTNVPTNPNNMAFQVLNLDPGIGDAEIGCTFRVH